MPALTSKRFKMCDEFSYHESTQVVREWQCQSILQTFYNNPNVSEHFGLMEILAQLLYDWLKFVTKIVFVIVVCVTH